MTDEEMWERVATISSLRDAYKAGRPLVVLRGGKVHSAVMGIAFKSEGVRYVDDGCMDPMPSRPADRFAEGKLEGRGPWTCGEHTFVEATPGTPEWRAWETILRLTAGDVAPHKARAQAMLMPRKQAGW